QQRRAPGQTPALTPSEDLHPFDVPGEGGDDHVRPVGHQVVERYPQRVDPVLELFDDVFLVAAVVGQRHHLLDGQVQVGGDVEEVPDLVEEGLFAAGLADVLA